jgi:hypothetical protein
MDKGKIENKPVDRKSSSNKDSSDESFVEGVHGNDDICVSQYFDYYAKIMNQQNMLMDNVRTGCYHDAIFLNM